MELGNLLFGNSRGRFECDRDKFGAYFHPLFDALDKIHGDDWSSFYRPFENDTFRIHPYCDCTCDPNSEHCEDDCPSLIPNFTFKKGEPQIEIEWYKRPFRSAYINVRVTDEELYEMVNRCINSLKEKPKSERSKRLLA